MKVKKTIILLTLVVFLASLANVYAGEMDDALASEDASRIEVSSTVGDNLQATNAMAEQTGNQDWNKLSSSGEFDELQKLIDNASDNGIINLEHNYTYTVGTDTITEGIGISKNLTINGNGFAIDAQGKSRIFNIDGGTNVLLNNITFTNGFSEGNGGAILAYGNVDIAGSRFINNTAVDGGAVESFNAKMTISESYFTSNNATEYGGAIYNFNSVVELSDSYFKDNYATQYGGAIYNFRGNVNVTQSQFTRNAAGSNGGAVSNSFGSVNVADANFSENAAAEGGALYLNDDSVTNCNFIANTAQVYGGALYFVKEATVKNCNFIANKAPGEDCGYGGAALFRQKGTIENCNFINNTASFSGGAISIISGNVTNSTFTANTASKWGGAITMGSGNLWDCNFTDNAAGYDAGAVNLLNGNVTNCIFTNNTADVNGGAMSMISGNVTDSIFTDNTGYDGGAVYFSEAGNVTDCSFSDNTAKGYGSAVRMLSGSVSNSNFTDNIGDHGAVNMGSGNVSNSNFVNNTASNDGGAVYIFKTGAVTNCTFTNNTAKSGDAIFISKGNISGCDFRNNYISKGAIHSVSGNITLSNNILDDNDVIESNNFAYIQNLIDKANSGDTILINGSYYGFGIPIRVTKSLTLIGENNATLDAKNLSKIFYIIADKVEIKNIHFTNGYSQNGGAVYFNKTGIVSNCTFTNNTANEDGGAIYFNCSGTVENCNFTNNTVTGFDSWGGAVFFWNPGSVKNCNFINNTANVSGGAVGFYDDGEVTNCNFTDNSANNTGGAVFFYEHGNVTNCNFADNSANKSGGAVFFYENSNVTNCNFADNKARNSGAIYFDRNGDVTNCIFTNNSATENGGAIHFYDGKGRIINGTFINNTAGKSGGAVYFGVVCNASKIDSVFIDNHANNGGAIYFNGGISNATISGLYNGNVAQRGGGAIFVRGKSMNNNFTADFIANEARAASGGAIFIYNQADNNTFEGSYWDNYAIYGGAIFCYNKANSNVFNSDFINNTAKSCGGAMFFYNTTDGNNFTGDFIANTALGEVDESVGNGGAITFKDTSSNSIFTCDFVNNTANLNGGGVNYRQTPYNITFNSNFINNTSPRGGGVNFFDTFENVIFNGDFIGNSAVKGGAIVTVDGIIDGVSFADNRAEEGGAVYIKGTGEVSNCIFTNNTATDDYGGGGAVYIGSGNVTDSIFISNRATGAGSLGGAVLIKNSGNVTDCSFEDNFAGFGGAVADEFNVNVNNCDFTANRASVEGGALYMGSGNIVNSNFANNNASDEDNEGDGGAVYVDRNVTVVNCNFTGNKAYRGSAIYFWVIGDLKYTRSISHSTFLNNRASMDPLSPFTLTVNENNIEIAFEGYDNLLNAILSRKMSDVNITNVTYWGANGVENTGNSTIVPVMLYTEAGQNVTVSGVVNGVPLNVSAVTDGEGKIVLNISAADNYCLTVRHDADSYYSEGEKTFTNMAFNVNVDSKTTTNRTVNLTAKSDIYSEVMPGNLVFILPNGTQINATYGGNGTWWAMHTFDECAVYRVGAAYIGLDNVSVRNATVTVFKALSKFSEVVIVANNVTLTLSDENGNPISGANVTYTVGGVSNTAVSDDKGSFVIAAESGAEIFADYAGSDDYVGSNITVKLTPQRQSTVILGENFTQYAVDYYAGERGQNFTVQLKDAEGNILANKTVLIGYNGKTLERTTDENGYASVQINLAAKNRLTFAVAFLGDEDYNATMSVYLITIEQKPVTISAGAKTYKATAKTKKYTVTLKTSKCSSADGKTYFKSGKKVTLKINGKTYTAQTNAKGQATFSLKITKKGIFTALIKYAGDNTYKSASKKVKIITM